MASSGLLDWKKTNDSHAFQVSLKTSTIRITCVEPQDPFAHNYTYDIEIFNESGTQIIKTHDKNLESDFKEAGLNAYDELTSLFEEAKSKALGIEDALNNVLDELDEMSPF
jgi:hypothetical protein